MNISKDVMMATSGASIGAIQTLLLRHYDSELGLVPIIGEHMPLGFGTWSSLGNIIIGSASTGASLFLGRNPTVQAILFGYGLSTLVGGITSGVLYSLPAGSMRLRRATPQRVATRRVVPSRKSVENAFQPRTPTAIPAKQILS